MQRMTASLVMLLCSWVLWERFTVHNPGEATQHLVDAVAESNSLAECRAASPAQAKKRADVFRNAYKESEYAVTEGNNVAILTDKRRKSTYMQYAYYCLPSTVDPYHDTR